MLLASAPLNTIELNAAVVEALTPVFNAEQVYRLEAHNASGTMLGYIDLWRAATWRERVNEHATLNFSYPNEDSKASLLAYPNQVWLTDGAGQLQQKFHVTEVTEEQNATGVNRQVQCESLMSQWNYERVSAFEIVSGSMTVGEVLRQLLRDFQENANPIQLGHIAPSIAQQVVGQGFKLDSLSLLEAVRRLQKQYRGYFYVDPKSRRFNWVERMGENKKQLIILGRNQMGLSVKTSQTHLITRIHALGAGLSPTSRVALPAPGYLDKNTGTYGVRTATLVFPEAKTTAELIRMTNRVLDKTAVLKKSYSVGVIDLSKVENNAEIDRKREAFTLGSTVRIANATLGVDLLTEIHGIERVLADPLRVSIELPEPIDEQPQEPEKDIFDRILDTERAVRSYGSQDIGFNEALEQGLKEVLDVEDTDEILTADDDGEGTMQDVIENNPNIVQDIADAVADLDTSVFARIFVDTDLTAVDTQISRLELEVSERDFALTTTGDDVLYKWKNGAWEVAGADISDSISTDTPQAVADAGAAGSTGEVSDAGHVHARHPNMAHITVSSSAPGTPSQGDLWLDTNFNILRVRDTTNAKWSGCSIIKNLTEPSGGTLEDGDLWWDDTNNCIRVYDKGGTRWLQASLIDGSPGGSSLRNGDIAITSGILTARISGTFERISHTDP